MTDLDNLIWHRKFLARIFGFDATPEYIHQHIGGLYTLEQIKQQMEK